MTNKQLKELRKYAKTNLGNFKFDKNAVKRAELGKYYIRHYKELEELQEENERRKNLES